MDKEVITVPNRPRGSFPYSPAIKAGDYIFISGQTGDRDNRGEEVKGIEAQTSVPMRVLTYVIANFFCPFISIEHKGPDATFISDIKHVSYCI